MISEEVWKFAKLLAKVEKSKIASLTMLAAGKLDKAYVRYESSSRSEREKKKEKKKRVSHLTRYKNTEKTPNALVLLKNSLEQ